jgi:pyridoxine 5-phosphate synthase
MQAKLSVNINKWATLRNARGYNNPNLIKTATDIQNFGGQGITIHPRPDERHIRYEDAKLLRPIVHTEFNIEGNPIPSFIDLVLEVKPEQVTLVPDAPSAITSDSGWDCKKHADFLAEVITTFKKEGIRTSIFLDANPIMVEAAAKTGTDRIELYTEPYASKYLLNRNEAVKDFITTAKIAEQSGLGVNAGHDLSLENIEFFAKSIPNLLEVSIGHALICEAIYFGLDNVVNQYLHRLQNS